MQCSSIHPADAAHDVYRVLIVDDEVAVCDVLAEVLRSPRRSIEVRDTPQAALEFLQHNPIDLAFVDVGMPGMSGFELAERIKQRYPHAHVVICTGYFGAELASEAEAVHVDHVLTKPVDFGELIQLANSYATE
jgi:CheY-like chemotaxis protein